jgi:hypothetical protein
MMRIASDCREFLSAYHYHAHKRSSLAEGDPVPDWQGALVNRGELIRELYAARNQKLFRRRYQHDSVTGASALASRHRRHCCWR